MPSHATLHFLCRRPGAAKGMRAQVLVRQLHAILLSEGVRLLRLLVLVLVFVLGLGLGLSNATSIAAGGR